MENHYDPNQPRVPVGHHGGGQWTSGSSFEALVSPSEKEVSGRDAEESDSADRSEELISKLAFLDQRPPTKPKQLAVKSVLALLAWLIARDSKGRRTVLDFRAGEFLRPGELSINLENVRTLEREEVEKYCKRLELVQTLTDKAVNELRPLFSLSQAPEFGTAVHERVADQINGKAQDNGNDQNNGNDPINRKPYPDLTAEQAMERVDAPGKVRYDVLEFNWKDRTVCIYDIKTGNRGLSWPRMSILARAAVELANGMRVIVLQVRPGQGQNPAR